MIICCCHLQQQYRKSCTLVAVLSASGFLCLFEWIISWQSSVHLCMITVKLGHAPSKKIDIYTPAYLAFNFRRNCRLAHVAHKASEIWLCFSLENERCTCMYSVSVGTQRCGMWCNLSSSFNLSFSLYKQKCYQIGILPPMKRTVQFRDT